MEKPEIKNPYLDSRILWNDVYGSLQIKLENSYRIIFYLSLTIALAIVGLIVMGTETKIKPIPFILHGNEVITLNNQNTTAFNDIKPKLSLLLVKDFIRHARNLSIDSAVNANNHISALSTVNGAAEKVLQDFFDAQKAEKNITKNISITNVLRETDHSFEIRWIEETRNSVTGEVINTNNYIAEITYTFESPSSNPIILEHNPLGFVISHLSWSEEKV